MPVPGLPFSDEQLWDVLNGVLPAWLLLAVAPRWRHTIPIVTLTAAFYSLLYVGAMAGSISGAAIVEVWVERMQREAAAAPVGAAGQHCRQCRCLEAVGLRATQQLRRAAPLPADHKTAKTT